MAKCKNLKDTCFEHENTFDYEKYKPTNADRIRSMTDEELVKFLRNLGACCSDDDEYCYKFKNCDECRLEWLKSEVGCE